VSAKKALLLFIVLFIGINCSREAQAAGAEALRLGVQDHLTEIKAVSVEGSYYVPLRDLTKELGLSLTIKPDTIEVKGRNGTLKLPSGRGKGTAPDGQEVSMDTFVRNGRLMAPVRLVTYFGYTVSCKPEKYLLRIQNSSAALDDTAFVVRFQDDMKPEPELVKSMETAVLNPGKTVFLTFDDGPSAATSQLLDILAEYDVKATFFMLGPHISSYPEQVKRTAKEKHGLGLHGMTHKKEMFYATPSAALSEMEEDNAILKKVAGVRTALIRTPYGSKPYFTKPFRDKLLGNGYNLWDWNVDSEDWKYKDDSAAVYNSVMAQVHSRQKAKINPVILMHDQKAALSVLPRILESLKKEGYQFQIITNDTAPVNFWKDAR
jgi:peptidoglycan-N-acetylglucosamine deacetylase